MEGIIEDALFFWKGKAMRITVYLTGGIAIYKAILVVRRLQKAGHQVRVVMTNNAEKFISARTLAALTKHPVLDDLWSKEEEEKIPHVELAKWSQLALVCPATADFMAKMANGLADDAASTAILATTAPKLLVPAMNDQMWHNPATQRNIATLIKDGTKIMPPACGLLAEGYAGRGRMPEAEDVLNWVQKFLNARSFLKGKKILVTAGGTRETIDPVRYIGNNSSGKMGIAIAKVARDAGAKVTLIYGHVETALPAGVKLISASSTEEMKNAVQKEFQHADALYMAAAVADWRPEESYTHKLKKRAGLNHLKLTLVKTGDILSQMAHNKQKDQIVVGFAAETDKLVPNARKKLKEKGADYIIANNVSKGVFGQDTDRVTILSQNGKVRKLPLMSKQKVAFELLKLL